MAKKAVDPMFDDEEAEDESPDAEEETEDNEGDDEDGPDPLDDDEGEDSSEDSDEDGDGVPDLMDEDFPSLKPKAKATPMPKSETSWMTPYQSEAPLPVCSGRKNSPHSSAEMHKAGTVWSGSRKVQRYRCPICGKTTIRRDVVKIRGAGPLASTPTERRPAMAQAKKKRRTHEAGWADSPLDP